MSYPGPWQAGYCHWGKADVYRVIGPARDGAVSMVNGEEVERAVKDAVLSFDEAERIAAAFNALQRAVCPTCRGRAAGGNVEVQCDDPQCGDSTWDHECTLGYTACTHEFHALAQRALGVPAKRCDLCGGSGVVRGGVGAGDGLSDGVNDVPCPYCLFRVP